MTKLYFLAAIAAVSIAALSAAAPIKMDTDRVVVSTAGLDLTTAKGLKTLDLRIIHAASSLCGTPSTSDALGWKKFNRCHDSARMAAKEQRKFVVEMASKMRKDTVASVR